MPTISFFVGWEIKDPKEAERIANILLNLEPMDFEKLGITKEFEEEAQKMLERGNKLLEKLKRERLYSKK